VFGVAAQARLVGWVFVGILCRSDAMSMDLFISCTRDGKAATFPRQLFEEIMTRGAVDTSLPVSTIAYADGSGGECGADDADMIDGADFVDFGGDIFFERIWELADRTGSYFTWPGADRPLAVTRSEFIKDVPRDVVEELGPVRVVANGRELAAVIADSDDFDDEDAGNLD
jgi:hypothetical protein